MNWKNLIMELQAAGLSQAAIGVAIGRSQAWVADVLRGRYKSVSWDDGHALMELHRQKVSPADTAQPDQVGG